MNRQFTEADRIKKKGRIKADAAASAQKAPPGLEEAIRGGIDKGYLPCATAWSIARKFKVPKNVVGDAADKLGLRISNCQLGCFKVDKNLHEDLSQKSIDQKALKSVDAHVSEKPLTCLEAFRLAKDIGVRPMNIADAANWRHFKIHECQLGCW